MNRFTSAGDIASPVIIDSGAITNTVAAYAICWSALYP